MICSQRFGNVVEDNQLLNFIILGWPCRLSRRFVRNGRRRETPRAIDHRADLAPGNRQLLAALRALEFDRHGALALTRRRMDDHSIGTCRPAGSKNVFKVELLDLLRQEQIIDRHAPTCTPISFYPGMQADREKQPPPSCRPWAKPTVYEYG